MTAILMNHEKQQERFSVVFEKKMMCFYKGTPLKDWGWRTRPCGYIKYLLFRVDTLGRQT
jgi:hypothetical protein